MWKNRHDNYNTPHYLANWAIKYVLSKNFDKADLTFLEPGCGDNAPFTSAAIFSKIPNITAIEKRDTKTYDTLKKRMEVFPDIEFNYDVRVDTDFLQCSDMWSGENKKFDIIAANPPFSIAEDFVYKSLALLESTGVMIFLLKLTFLSSLKRQPLFNIYPPDEVIVLQKRPSFTNDSKTDMTEYAFFVWLGTRRRAVSCNTEEPITVLKWLNNKLLEQK